MEVTIGTFHKLGEEFHGQIETLSIHADNVCFIPEPKRVLPSADYRIVFRQSEIGGAWRRRSGTGAEYLAVKIVDPSFVTPIYGHLFADKANDTYKLVWKGKEG